MADTLDLLDWQTRLRELAAQSAEGTWVDPGLDALEQSVVHDVSVTATAWMLRLWLLARRALKTGDESDIETALDAADKEPADTENLSQKLAEAAKIGEKRVAHQKKLLDRGPWIDVPPRPVKRPIPRMPKVHATAEFLARQSAAAKMREWAEGMKEDVRWQVVQAIRERATADELAKRIRDKWDVRGVDFQRIAVTEMSMAYNDAVLTHLADDYVVVPPIGDERVCKECARWIEGRVFWVSPVPIENPTKQEYQQYVWAGKSNVGRKREDWWPCVPLHPNCRHVYVRYRGGDPSEYRPYRIQRNP